MIVHAGGMVLEEERGGSAEKSKTQTRTENWSIFCSRWRDQQDRRPSSGPVGVETKKGTGSLPPREKKAEDSWLATAQATDWRLPSELETTISEKGRSSPGALQERYLRRMQSEGGYNKKKGTCHKKMSENNSLQEEGMIIIERSQ